MTAAQQGKVPSAQGQLAGVLRGLRQAAGLSPAKFAATATLPELQVKLIEEGSALPSRDALHAYLEVAGAPPRARAQAMTLWSMAHKGHEERRKSRRASHADDGGPQTVLMSQAETQALHEFLEDPSAMHYAGRGRGREITTTRLTLSKPSWRRAAQTSQADHDLWPLPEDVTSNCEFTRALEGIKRSTGLSYKALAEASSRTNYPLATSTVHAMCTKPRLPHSVDSVRCFIRICGGDDLLVRRWGVAWQRLRQADTRPLAVVEPSAIEPAVAAAAEVGRQQLVEANSDVEVAREQFVEVNVDEEDVKVEENVVLLHPQAVWVGPDEMVKKDAAAEVVSVSTPARLRQGLLWVLVFVLGMATGALLLHLLI